MCSFSGDYAGCATGVSRLWRGAGLCGMIRRSWIGLTSVRLGATCTAFLADPFRVVGGTVDAKLGIKGLKGVVG